MAKLSSVLNGGFGIFPSLLFLVSSRGLYVPPRTQARAYMYAQRYLFCFPFLCYCGFGGAAVGGVGGGVYAQRVTLYVWFAGVCGGGDDKVVTFLP